MFTAPSAVRALSTIEDDLSGLPKALFEHLPLESQTSQEVARHILGSGKMIRPSLFFLSADLLGYHGAHRMPIACVSEYVHTASLLHDDVLDSSTLRRNKPTARSIWGDQASVLVGDLIYSRASELMAATGNQYVVEAFASAIRKMSEGELIQLEEIYNPSITIERYLKIVTYKTATLLAATCRSAGLLAEAAKSSIEALELFGYHVGVAFQLIDDGLDYLSSDRELGKNTLADLKEGKVTLPFIYVRHFLDEEERKKIFDAVTSRLVTEEAVALLCRRIADHGVVDRVMKDAEYHTEKALAALTLFGEEANHLRDAARLLLKRTV